MAADGTHRAVPKCAEGGAVVVATAPSWPLGTAPTSKTRELTMAKADTKAGKQPKSGKKRMSSSDMLRVRIDSQTIWQMIGAVVLTLAALWAMNQARSLLWMLILSFFFSLALQPGVNGLVSRYGWRRGAAVGVIYLGGIIAAIVMILFLIPANARLTTAIGESGAQWIATGTAWSSDIFGVEFPSPGDRQPRRGAG